MNLECTLLNQDSYNYQEYHTVTERAFFHWLKSFGTRHIKDSKLNLDRTQNSNDVYYKEKDNTNRVV